MVSAPEWGVQIRGNGAEDNGESGMIVMMGLLTMRMMVMIMLLMRMLSVVGECADDDRYDAAAFCVNDVGDDLALGADDVFVAGNCGVDADCSRFPGQCNVDSC